MSRPTDGREPGGPKGRPASPGGVRPSKGPKPLADILGDLFASRGLARVQALGDLEAAWVVAVGEVAARHTKVDGLRRGVLGVIVAHPTLLEELASFQKSNLLTSLRRSLAGTPIHDIRFRVGPVEPDRPGPPPSPGPTAPRGGRRRP